jgi:hypothetical protein
MQRLAHRADSFPRWRRPVTTKLGVLLAMSGESMVREAGPAIRWNRETWSARAKIRAWAKFRLDWRSGAMAGMRLVCRTQRSDANAPRSNIVDLEGLMSQQYPGQPAGAGGTPPAYGGPPGATPGAYVPQGAPGHVTPGLAQPPKTNRTLLIVGMGCGLFLLIAVAAVVAVLFWLKSRSNAVIEDLQRLQASASAMAAVSEPPSGPSAPANSVVDMSGDCKLAYACCGAIAAKSPAGAAAAQACQVFKTSGYPQSTCSLALSGYRKVAEQAGVKCE